MSVQLTCRGSFHYTQSSWHDAGFQTTIRYKENFWFSMRFWMPVTADDSYVAAVLILWRSHVVLLFIFQYQNMSILLSTPPMLVNLQLKRLFKIATLHTDKTKQEIIMQNYEPRECVNVVIDVVCLVEWLGALSLVSSWPWMSVFATNELFLKSISYTMKWSELDR